MEDMIFLNVRTFSYERLKLKKYYAILNTVFFAQKYGNIILVRGERK